MYDEGVNKIRLEKKKRKDGERLERCVEGDGGKRKEQEREGEEGLREML